MSLRPYDPPRLAPATAPSAYIQIDEQEVMRVPGTRVGIDSILALFREGRDAESIWRSFPSASLEQVYGVIAYYLGNRSEVDAYLRSHEAAWEYFRAWSDAQPSPARDRIRAMKQENESAGSRI